MRNIDAARMTGGTSGDGTMPIPLYTTSSLRSYQVPCFRTEIVLFCFVALYRYAPILCMLVHQTTVYLATYCVAYAFLPPVSCPVSACFPALETIGSYTSAGYVPVVYCSHLCCSYLPCSLLPCSYPVPSAIRPGHLSPCCDLFALFRADQGATSGFHGC